MAQWKKPGVPHKGWTEIGIVDLGEKAMPGDEIEYEQCEMCGQDKIRYVHILTHPEYEGTIQVGCDCAMRMTEGYFHSDRKERELRNRVNRKRNFMKQEWRINSKTGNLVLRYKGENITIMRSQFGEGWGVIFKGESLWKYDGKKIMDLEEAKIAAFNLFDRLYDSRGEVQPHWENGEWIYY